MHFYRSLKKVDELPFFLLISLNSAVHQNLLIGFITSYLLLMGGEQIPPLSLSSLFQEIEYA